MNAVVNSHSPLAAADASTTAGTVTLGEVRSRYRRATFIVAFGTRVICRRIGARELSEITLGVQEP